jgi:hypothetical protein
VQVQPDALVEHAVSDNNDRHRHIASYEQSSGGRMTLRVSANIAPGRIQQHPPNRWRLRRVNQIYKVHSSQRLGRAANQFQELRRNGLKPAVGIGCDGCDNRATVVACCLSHSPNEHYWPPLLATSRVLKKAGVAYRWSVAPSARPQEPLLLGLELRF